MTPTCSGPGAQLPELARVVVEDGSPIVAAGDDVEVINEEAHEGLDRDAAGHQVQLLEGEPLAILVGVDVRP